MDKLLRESLKYINHTHAKWVNEKWVGKTCARVDSFDQSGDWRCNCGADDLKKRIRAALQPRRVCETERI